MPRQLKCRRNGDNTVLYCGRTTSADNTVRKVNLDAESLEIIQHTTETLKGITGIEPSLGVLVRRAIRALEMHILREMETLAVLDNKDEVDLDRFFADYEDFCRFERKYLFAVAGVEDK